MRPWAVVLVVGTLLPAAAEAQFSSDFPGVPRASISQHGPAQGRFEMDLSAMRIGASSDAEGGIDSTAVALRLGFGRSWRVRSNLEVGFDWTLGDAGLLRLSGDEGLAEDPEGSFLAVVGYGLRLGVKLRPLAYVDPDGYGVSAAIGLGVQPGLRPLVSVLKRGDSTFISGAFGDDEEVSHRIPSATQVMAGVSYRNPRGEVDLAVVVEGGGTGSPDVAPFQAHSGTTVRLGGRYWLTSSFGLGAVFWGSGAPPWRDRTRLGPRDSDDGSFAFVLSWDPLVEKGRDLIISSPTGRFSESISVSFRVR